MGINGSKACYLLYEYYRASLCFTSLLRRHQVPVGEALLGRVIDGFGRPLDGRELPDVCWKDHDAMPPSRNGSTAYHQPLMTGIRAIDSVATCGEGQRVGIFSAPCVGKARFWRCCAMPHDCNVLR